ncbi:glycoprotein 3-alpha-L-fucosyltransferase A-like [Apostichopus japonicus]|uniref:glycoprotein 3-alpha-L-fucosyltransferase A-like n=1 Tax=Stichopus japonicus TaxID=307972 RepID=UPI003AB521C6
MKCLRINRRKCTCILIISAALSIYALFTLETKIDRSTLRQPWNLMARAQLSNNTKLLSSDGNRMPTADRKYCNNTIFTQSEKTSKRHDDIIEAKVDYRVEAFPSEGHWTNKLQLPKLISCGGRQPRSVLIEQASHWTNNTQKADILIFSGAINCEDIWLELESKRQPNQIWVFTTEESPFTSRDSVPPPKVSHIHFNITSTYHPKADIILPYGRFFPFSKRGKREVRSNFNQKKGLMAWISSHCSTEMWRRYDAVHDLSGYIPIDMFGACGELSCPRRRGINCAKVFARYKFIVAFENSCCGGYITEKFWFTVTRYNAIPVVIGPPKMDYEQLVPPNSFIHADDFSSMKDLAEYILRVSQDQALYDSYFKWKTIGKAVNNCIVDILAFTNVGMCRLIDFIREKQHELPKQPFDPYGPNWMGGCNECGERNWVKEYSTFRYYNEEIDDRYNFTYFN